ncbi:hypothetical protein L7F22_027040 [Adiantum nelumboides]|nr:hypothetical protein [Adiantum nelumboides]
MAAFGSFAGLVTAGVGALCGYEADVLRMFDFASAATSSSSSCSHGSDHPQARSVEKIDHQQQASSSNGSNYCLDAPVDT